LIFTIFEEMGFRSALSRPLSKWIWSKHQRWVAEPGHAQLKWFSNLIRKGSGTQFGADHGFADIKDHRDYIRQVPVRDYEEFRPYIELIKQGKSNVLWPGKPAYFAKTSGTTSGTKYIPVSRESMPFHISAARDALLAYIFEKSDGRFLDGKLMFLSGSPTLEEVGGVLTGRLSGIVNHHVPGYLRSNQLPDYQTNCIEDWEEKLKAIVKLTLGQDLSLISGIPPWVQMYFDQLIDKTSKPVMDVFPNLQMFVYGGVNFEPYRKRLFESIGRQIPSIETYPASEGFIAFQNQQEDQSLLLLADQGIFFEFIPADQYFSDQPPRLSIDEVKTGVNYALVMSTNAGLWAYSIGDMVKFTSLNPHKILVTGRIKHFISAFGEHVIGEEVEKAMAMARLDFPEVQVTEFSVAPVVNPSEGLSHHEWLIEFEVLPHDLIAFSAQLDMALRSLNSYYDDLITGNILCPLKVKPLSKGAFVRYMKSQGKLGGQNKVPRLSNDRVLADALLRLEE
jgi:hypothetical protein